MNTISTTVNRYRKSEFVRNVFTVFSGVSFAQIIPFFVSPILTRLYSPTDFALFGLFTSTAMFFGNIATLQYDKAIMLPEEIEDAVNVMVLSLISVLVMTSISAIVVILLNKFLLDLMGNQSMRIWLYLVPISVFLGGIFRTLNMWASRIKAFKRVAARNISQTTVGAGSKLIFGFLRYTSGGLIIGSLLGQSFSTALLVAQTMKDEIHRKYLSFQGMRINAIKYKDFPLFTNWQGFSDMVNTTGSRYIISNIFGATVLGLFSFTFGILQKPLQVIGYSISQVFFQKIADNYNKNKNVWPLIKKILTRLLFVGAMIFIPIFLFGPKIFQFVFGESWRGAGIYARLLVPWLFAKFVISPISSIPLVLKKQKQFVIYSLILNIYVPISIFTFGIVTNNFQVALLISSIGVMFYLVALMFWFKRILKNANYTDIGINNEI